MSTKGYSNDLRQRVVEYIKTGGKYAQASKQFKISVSALGRWYRRYKQEGSYEMRKKLGSKRRINLEKLSCYVQKAPDTNLRILAQELKVSTFTISYWLRQLGFTYKKKPIPMWKQTRKSERNI